MKVIYKLFEKTHEQPEPPADWIKFLREDARTGRKEYKLVTGVMQEKHSVSILCKFMLGCMATVLLLYPSRE